MKNRFSPLRYVIPLVTLCVFMRGEQLSAATAPAWSAKTESRGLHSFVVPIEAWGRYSLRGAGEHPVALAVADKRTGNIGRDGEPGQRNGRIDIFLDKGDYRLTVRGAKGAAGPATVSATPFGYPDGFKPSYLIPLKDNRLSLEDVQQAAFWFEVASDTGIYIEAAGRNLEDMRLWRDGEWLVETNNRSFTVRPKPETPLKGIALFARVPKGTYMVSCYGGPGMAWAVESPNHPLYVKWGMESLAADIVMNAAIPPQGYVQMLLAPEVSTVVAEAPDRKPLLFEVNRLGSDFSSAGWLATDSIHAKSAAPRIALRLGSGSENGGYRLLKISGTPEAPFTLQTMSESSGDISCATPTEFWVSSLHTGNFRDQIGAGGLVVDRSSGAIVALQADTISPDRELAKRFNLLEEENLFVWVGAEGKYSVTPGGTGFSWRFVRYFLTNPPKFVTPDWTGGAGTVDLSEGLYRLELNPDKKGVATLTIRKASLLGGLVAAGKAVLGGADDAKRTWNAPAPAMQFPRIAADNHTSYSVICNSQSPELSSFVIRSLPINPDLPLSFWSKPGENVRIPVRLGGERIVTIRDSRGVSAPFEIEGKKYEKSAQLEAGVYALDIAEGAQEPRRLALTAIPPERLSSAPPLPFPDALVAAFPRFPVVSAGKTVFLDLDRKSNRLYAIDVREPALYRIETTGRLNTELVLRDRFANFSRSARSNGVGRNAMLIEYLLAGQYQLTVATQEQSAGHLGLAAYRNPLQEGGELEAGIDNRSFAPAFSGIGYEVKILTSGNYRVESVGQNGNFPLRLEDREGWPLEPAVSSGPMEQTLDKGAYRLISLPTSQDGRRIARLTALRESVRIRGKGPHPLLINSTAASTWEEKSGKGTGGDSAVFTFDLPASIAAKLVISAGFTGTLYPRDKDSALVTWTGIKSADLGTGAYRIAVKPVKKSNYAPYQVSVSTIDLIPGLSYPLSRPKTLGVNVGASGVVELGSQGSLDAAATLLDKDGKTVLAANDDGYMDWNFSISRALKPGRYFLRVESAEGAFTQTRVFMRALSDTCLDSLATAQGAPRVVRCNLERHIGVFPLSKADTGDVIAFAVQGKSRMGCSLEKKSAANGGEWAPIAQDHGDAPAISIPRVRNATYRFKVWSENNMAEAVSVTYACTGARQVTWNKAADELSGSAPLVGSHGSAWFKIDLSSHAPGHFRVSAQQNELSGIAVSTALDSALADESASFFASSQEFAWVEFRFEREGRFRVKLEPMVLDNEKPLVMSLVGSRPRAFETRALEKTVGLFEAETDGYHPLCGTAARRGLPALAVRGVAVDQSMWIGEGRCAAGVLPGEERRVTVWNGISPIDGTQPSARLRYTLLPIIDEGVQSAGTSSWVSKKTGARLTHCQKGQPLLLRITLPPRSAALVTRSDGTKLLECSPDNEPQVREFTTDGGDVYLLALQPETRFDVAALAFSQAAKGRPSARTLSEAGWEMKLAREGTLQLPVNVKDGGKRRLFYQGAVTRIDWVGGDGRLRDNLSDGAEIGPGGFLVLRYEAGWVKMDLCAGAKAEDIMACKWKASIAPSGALEVRQSSQFTLANTTSWFSLSLADSQHVNFASPLPLAAILLRDGKPVNYQEAWERFNWDLPLPPGKYQLGVHPVAGSSLEGGELAVLFRSIAPISDKQPFTGYFAPGESRLLSFGVKAKAKFGIGLRMNSETVEARLYDGSGAVVAQGKQQFVSLEKGTYYLWLRVPLGAEGTQCTAYLFGQDAPPNEPPERLVRWIISGEEGPRPKLSSNDEEDTAKSRPSWQQEGTDEEQAAPQESQGPEGGSYNSGDQEQPQNTPQESEGQTNESGQESGGGQNEGD